MVLISVWSLSSNALERQYSRDIQIILTALGYDPGPIDGKSGNRTDAAIKSYQKDAGLAITGRVSTDLWVKLQATSLPKDFTPKTFKTNDGCKIAISRTESGTMKQEEVCNSVEIGPNGEIRLPGGRPLF